MTKRISSGALILAAGATAAISIASPEPGGSPNIRAAPRSETMLYVPTVNYREEWVQIGSFSVLSEDPENGAKELHVVYAPRDDVEAYLEANHFRDGTVLVKDVFVTRTESMTTGTVSYADELVGRFVMVRDSAGTYAGSSPLWGDGWGWAFYEGAETNQTVTTDYRVDCLGCHEPARPQNLIYSQGYPILRRAASTPRPPR